MFVFFVTVSIFSQGQLHRLLLASIFGRLRNLEKSKGSKESTPVFLNIIQSFIHINFIFFHVLTCQTSHLLVVSLPPRKFKYAKFKGLIEPQSTAHKSAKQHEV